MTIIVANTANTSTFDYWRNRTNELADAMTNKTVTVDSNTATGNAAITGTFTSNVLFLGNTTVNTTVNSSSVTSNVLFLGNTTVNTTVNSSSVFISNSTSNLTITTPTASQYANGKFFLNANGSFTLIEALTKGSVETSGTTNTEINNYLTNTYASAEYLFAVKDNNANNYYASKVLVTHDVDNAYLSEYAIIVSNTYVGSFFANSNTSHVRVNFNPTSTNTTINFTRIEA
tara:strand:+ start:11661 stop:12353 length:693 start_codon:yes stop_codon:yes gene_type:complete